MVRHLGNFASRLAFPVMLGIVWQAAAILLDNPSVLPRLETVAAIVFAPNARLLITGSLLDNTLVSLIRVILGFLLAASVSVPLGIVMGYSRTAEQILDSGIEMLRPVPPLAWVPLVLAWLGITGISDIFPFFGASPIFSNIQFSALIIIFIGAFFPILLNTIQGVKNIPPVYLESARTLGAKNFSILIKVIIPGAAPVIATGLRIGLGIGWMCLVAAEMLPGSNSGLGYLIWYAYELLRADIIVAGIIVIGLIGLLMDRAFKLIEKRIDWANRM